MLRKPVQPFNKSITSNSASSLNVPGAPSNSVESELVSDLGAGHSTRQVLLIGENEQNSVFQLLFTKHLVQLLSILFNTVSIIRVHDEDQPLGVLVVVAPQQTDLVLTTDIPHIERDVLVFDGLDVEADRGDGVDDLAEFHLVEDGGFAGGVEADHEDTHFFGADHAFPDFGEKGAHFFFDFKWEDRTDLF